MNLLIAGDGHSAGAMATNCFRYASDDEKYSAFHQTPHPENLAVSWGVKLADLIKLPTHQSANIDATNESIIATITEWLDLYDYTDGDAFVIAGWPDPNEEVVDFHRVLKERGIKHLFFSTIDSIDEINDEDLKKSFIFKSYTDYLLEQGFEHVITSDVYFDKKAHSTWAKFLLCYIVRHKLI